MLLIESGRRMAPYEDRAWIRQGVEEARRRFAENFLRDGRLITNNPERRNAPGPAKKKGVCPYCYRYMDGLKPNRVRPVHLPGLCRQNRRYPLRPYLRAVLRADDAGLYPQRPADG